MKNKAGLGIGPMSPEVIEAVFRYSNFNRRELMLIASKNQIDYGGGYVNNWNTEEFAGFIRLMKDNYPDSNVKICRDHCGPGFNGKFELDDTYKTIENDIKNGFDLIHIDFCHFKGSRDEKLEESKKAIEYCLKLNPAIELEIGTDENEGTNFSISVLNEIEEEIDFFARFCNPKYFVVQTGSLVKEINQVGNFNKELITKVRSILQTKGLMLKEHNADYLSKNDISKREGVIDALNIAPQLGVIQTMLVLKKCRVYGIPFDGFLDEVYSSGKWKKWLYKNKPENKFLCAIIAGHYLFGSKSYKTIIKELEDREDIHENIINEIMEVIGHYDI